MAALCFGSKQEAVPAKEGGINKYITLGAEVNSKFSSDPFVIEERIFSRPPTIWKKKVVWVKQSFTNEALGDLKLNFSYPALRMALDTVIFGVFHTWLMKMEEPFFFFSMWLLHYLL
uniref:Uncharacterized protein n=1 Tax=Plectus sambesii TaxID=2011161 RepID=A0A914V062_9BILA